ncbi:MAG: hypothetical protein J6252_00415 [Clostridia bacterium]|nr:hypothetical protein [Clostridia bacterium]
MKRLAEDIIALTLCAIFALSLFACGQTGTPDAGSAAESSAAESRAEETSADGSAPDEDAALTIYTLHTFWLDVSSKTVTGSAAAELGRALAESDETGKTLPALADEEPADGAWNIDYLYFADSLNYDVKELGLTQWVETNGKLYRFDLNGASLVERPLGEGRELAVDGEVKRMISGAWNYWPYDAYSVDYDVSTGAVTSARVYESESDVAVTVKSVRIKDGTEDSYDKVGILTFTVTSETGREIECLLVCNQSDDNLGSEKSVSLELAAAESREVEMEFEPYGRGFVPVLTAGNTLVRINLKGTEN